MGAADRVDRRQVDDVEAHRGRPLELALGVAKRPVAAGDVGAGKELVPGGEARPLAIDDDLVFALGPGRVGAVEVGVHEAAERGVVRGRRGGGPVAVGEGLGPAGQHPGVVAGCAPGGRLDQRRALAQLAGHVLARRHPLVEVGQPGAERVGQRLDRVDVARVVLEDERARPAIVREVDLHLRIHFQQVVESVHVVEVIVRSDREVDLLQIDVHRGAVFLEGVGVRSGVEEDRLPVVLDQHRVAVILGEPRRLLAEGVVEIRDRHLRRGSRSRRLFCGECE